MDPRAHNTEENTSHKGHHQVLIVLRSLIVSLRGVTQEQEEKTVFYLLLLSLKIVVN